MSQTASNGDVKLLQFLVQQGMIANDVATRVERDLAEAQGSESALAILSRDRLVSEEAVAQALASRLRLPVVNLATHGLDQTLVNQVREDLSLKYGVLPLRMHNDTLVLAVQNPLDREAMQAIAFASGRPVRAEVATHSALHDAIKHAYHLEESLNAYLDGVSADGDAEVARMPVSEADLSKLVRETELPPVVKLLNVILVDGIRGGASDIHIETTLSDVRVRYRIDGVLHEAFRLPKWVQDPLTARCKVLASLDITERRIPQDGRIRINYQAKMVDLRVSSLPTQFGEKVTMRILDPSTGPRGIDSLALQKRDMDCLRQAISRPQGLAVETEKAQVPTALPRTAPEAAPQPAVTRRFHALVIDDEADFRFLLKTFLEHSGISFEVTTAANGKEGLACAERQTPDLILLDIMMPEMDGFEVCKRLRSSMRTAFVPILMLTALNDAANRTRGFLAGTDDYIGKPFDRSELTARVRRIMDRTYGSLEGDGMTSLELSDPGAEVEGRVDPPASYG